MLFAAAAAAAAAALFLLFSAFLLAVFTVEQHKNIITAREGTKGWEVGGGARVSGGVSSSVLQCFSQHGKLALYWRQGQRRTAEALKNQPTSASCTAAKTVAGEMGRF